MRNEEKAIVTRGREKEKPAEVAGDAQVLRAADGPGRHRYKYAEESKGKV